MKVEIVAGDDVLRSFANQIGALSQGEAHKALARAVNRVTNTVHGRVARAVARQSNIPLRVVRAQVKKRLVQPGSGDTLEGVVWSRERPLSLKVFKPRQLSFGVKAYFDNRWNKFPGAFMGPRPGAIALKLHGHVWQRTSSKRLPIEKLYGPSVPEEMVRDQSKRVFEETVATMLPERVRHELGRLLPS